MLIIAGMAVVTYIPRMLPFLFMDKIKISPLVKRILRNVPYAMLGALIFPGILNVSEDIYFGIIGACTALFLAFMGLDVIIVVLLTIGVLSCYLYLI
ncbi:branched-chain amino acid transporter [Lottiidibacillus patelloidae]|uniref:Branched-chain amino acid transporter n=2 Tax=Lottiidibacillus patelloidae TaxID=2670334 RepID=A0A263BZQ0_9BACI|nr:branched-chain amino acid transporter [Lottiidibacillus patelloidae]